MKTQILNLLATVTLTFSFATTAHADSHNLSSNPVASLLGFSNVEYSYKLVDHLTIGITGSSGKMKLNDIELTRSTYGAVARFYFQPAFQNSSWYLVAAGNKLNSEGTILSNGITYKGKLDEIVASGGAGYHWFWTSFNMNLAGLLSNQSTMELKDTAGNKYKDDANGTLNFEFNIGWKF